MRAAPDRSDLRLRAASFLVEMGRAAEAVRLTEDAARAMPENREILLMRATTLEFARRTEEAGDLLKQIERRWPEWPAGWAAHGIILAGHEHYAEARQALEAATALGSRNGEIHFFLAKTYEALGLKQEAKAAREKVPQNLSESAWLSRVFQGSLLHDEAARP